MAQPFTLAHALVVAMAFCFTGWLIERGQDPLAALLITFAALAGTVTVTRATWQGALAVVRRLTSSA